MNVMDPSLSSDTTTTLSSTPFSPFSSARSFDSEAATSDEPADLGHFAGIFRALNELQYQTRGNGTPSIIPTIRNPSRTAPASRAHSRIRPGIATPRVLAALSDDSSDEVDVGRNRLSGMNQASENILEHVTSSSNPLRTRSSRNSLHASRSEYFRSVPNLILDPADGELVFAAGELELDDNSELLSSPTRPTLGGFDDVLVFLAEERAKVGAQRQRGGPEATQVADRNLGYNAKQPALYLTPDSAGQGSAESRRKRRRKRTKLALMSTSAGSGSGGGSSGSRRKQIADSDHEGDDADADGSSSQNEPEAELLSSSPTNARSTTSISSFVALSRSAPRPPRKDRLRQKQPPTILLDRTGIPKLSHSRSTPSLRPPTQTGGLIVLPKRDGPLSPLSGLVTKLKIMFPEDRQWLSSIRWSSSFDVADPRGRSYQRGDPLIHIFIDHSNILIGFINYLKRTSVQVRRTKPYMSHSALALVLERGRPVSRRVLVASSPLYQPIDKAEQLGYEVRVYARVPDSGDGADRLPRGDKEKASGGRPIPRRKGQSHGRNHSAGLIGESDSGTGGFTVSPSSPSSLPSSSKTAQAPQLNGLVHGGAGPGHPQTSPARVRYREQGVDELLQLKLLQAVADVDSPPPGSTIVLATGDGNVGQFNDEGFLGCVRTALKKGWRVELYAWVVGLSKAWMREFGDGPYKDRFHIVELEHFGVDLLELY